MSEIPRLFIQKSFIDKENKTIFLQNEEEIHYLKNVIRLKPRQMVIVSDGESEVFETTLKNTSPEGMTLEIQSSQETLPWPSFPITLIQSVLKGEKQDFVIQKATELGVSKVHCITTERSGVILKTDKDLEKKQQRWQKIALNAAKQSKRLNVPEVKLFKSLESYLKQNFSEMKNATYFVCHEKEKEKTLKSLLNKQEEHLPFYIFIGPEGGWSATETKILEKYAIPKVSLGKNILRAETASILTIGLVIYERET